MYTTMVAEQKSVSYLRNFVFGVEDSLVSTVGLLSGVAIAGMARESIVLTGVVLIFVEAVSMAAGSFLAETSAETYEEHSETLSKRSYISAVIMFISYFVAGFIPLAPYYFQFVLRPLPVSIGLSIIALFILGAFSAALSRTSWIRDGLRMLLIGGLAILVGVVVGAYFRI